MSRQDSFDIVDRAVLYCTWTMTIIIFLVVVWMGRKVMDIHEAITSAEVVQTEVTYGD